MKEQMPSSRNVSMSARSTGFHTMPLRMRLEQRRGHSHLKTVLKRRAKSATQARATHRVTKTPEFSRSLTES